MYRMTTALLLVTLTLGLVRAQDDAGNADKRRIKYGSNPVASDTFIHDGVKLYYEVYGSGEPILVVHGNGGSIITLSSQIDYFHEKYMVVAMDSRDQGRSDNSPGPLTYEKMADDLAALIDHLEMGPVNVLGWSDGGVEALLLGIRHPAKVKKLAVMAANLNPTEDALYPEFISVFKQRVEALSQQPETAATRREMKVSRIVLDQPNIAPKMLESIKAPTLVMAGDHDIVRVEHTIEIFNHIPNSQLAIFPNSTHMVPYDDPALFNHAVDRFFRTPYAKKDRFKEMMESIMKMIAEFREEPTPE